MLNSLNNNLYLNIKCTAFDNKIINNWLVFLFLYILTSSLFINPILIPLIPFLFIQVLVWTSSLGLKK